MKYNPNMMCPILRFGQQYEMINLKIWPLHVIFTWADHVTQIHILYRGRANLLFTKEPRCHVSSIFKAHIGFNFQKHFLSNSYIITAILSGMPNSSLVRHLLRAL